MSSFLQTNKLVSHSLMDAKRWYENPKSKTKEFITQSMVSSVNINLFLRVLSAPKFYKGDRDGSKDSLHMQWFVFQEMNCEHREGQYFTVNNK